MTTAFVLSGGASLRAIQVGMLRALLEEDIHPDLIVGTSVGAVNGAFLATRGLSAGTVDDLGDLWRAMRRRRIFPFEPLTGFLGFAGLRDNFVPDGSLRRLIARHLDAERLEDLSIPLHVVACDVLTGSEVRLSRGPLVDAVMASAAIPGVFPPVAWEGRLLMDGGVVDNTPISHALDLGADLVYVLSTGGPCELSAAPHGALAMLIHATALMVGGRFTAEARMLAGRPDVIIVPPPCPVNVEPMDFSHADDLIRRAEAEARGFLADRRVVQLPQRRRQRAARAR